MLVTVCTVSVSVPPPQDLVEGTVRPPGQPQSKALGDNLGQFQANASTHIQTLRSHIKVYDFKTVLHFIRVCVFFCVLIAMCPFAENLSLMLCLLFYLSLPLQGRTAQDLRTTAYNQGALLCNSKNFFKDLDWLSLSV